MIQIKNNSVICSLLTSHNIKMFIELQNYLAINGINACFSDVSVSLNGNTYTIPEKARKSLNSLLLWVVYVS